MMKIKKSDLAKLSKEDLIAIAHEADKIKQSAKFRTLDSYWETTHEDQVDFHKAAKTHRIRYFSGGNRCVIGSTLVATMDGEKAIADIHQSTEFLSYRPGTQKFQLSLGSTPYPKAKESLYRVVHTQGELVGSAHHQIFCSDGEYRSLAGLSEGQDVLFLPKHQASLSRQETSLALSQRESSEGDQRSWKKFLGLLGHCESYSHPRGQLLLEKLIACQDEFRLGSDALRFFRPGDHAGIDHLDDLVQSSVERNRLYQLYDLICNAYLSGPLEVHYASEFLKNNNFEPFERTCLSSREFLQSLERFVSHLKDGGFVPETIEFLSSLTDLTHEAETVKVLAIEPLGRDEWVWDLTVLGNHNYISNGLVSHNSGKSTAGFVEDIMLARGTHPYITNRVPNKGLVVIQDFENAGKNILEPKFEEWAPEGDITRVEKTQTGAWKKIHFKCGSTIDVLSHDQDMKVFEGSDYDWAHFDEPPPKHIYTAVWRGLTDRGGRMHMTATPLASPWLFGEYKKALAGDPLRWFRFVPTKKNAKNLGGGDVALGMKRIEEFASMLTDEEKSARLDGVMVQMQGLIFKQFKKEHHMIPKFDIPQHWNIWESIDPHPHKPWSVVWIAISEGGHKILVRTAMLEGTLDEIAESILYERTKIGVRNDGRPRIVRCVIDNSSSVPLWQKSNTDPTMERISVREELENYIGPRANGPCIEVAPKNVSQKIDLFKRWLFIETKSDGRKESVFYAFDGQENERFVFEIENYVWDSSRGKGLKDQPKKVDDDCLDAIMQIALSLPKDENRDLVSTPVRIWESKSWTVR